MSDLEQRQAAWNADAARRIAELRERAEARAFARSFVAGVGAVARDLARPALEALLRGLVADALEDFEKKRRK